jgi:hypothetical protein
MEGKLEKTEQGWIINHDGHYIEVDTSDYKYLNDMWIGDTVEFTVTTIADGTSEWDVMDKDVAKITFEANFFQNELHNNFVVSSDYRNQKSNLDMVYKDLIEDKDAEYRYWLKLILRDLTDKNYKISKKL